MISKPGTSKAEQSKSERRSRQRLVARLPVGVRNHGGSAEVTAHTRDVSTNGVFLYTESRMAEGSDVELILILPPELTSGEKCWVCCHARILRVEQGPGKDFGVAAEIRRMDILPEIPA
ncbi:MAG: PilZ domain-containing protein [Candidatus Sulfotelmatobacter sp.]